MEETNINLPLMVGLNILDLYKLINEPIYHDPSWPNMLDKIPSKIPKFEGNMKMIPQTISCHSAYDVPFIA